MLGQCYCFYVYRPKGKQLSAWRRRAIEAVPDLKHTLEIAEQPMEAWIEISLYFDSLNLEDDTNIIENILSYARWCLRNSARKSTNMASTAVCCAFYEHLPGNPENWSYFRSWFTPSEFESLKDVFSYHLKGDELNNLRSVFYDL